MKLFFSCLAAFLFVIAPARADVPASSLFFTQAEIDKMHAPENHQKAPPPPPPDIHLGAVFYYGPHDWVLWMQGERWTPATTHDDIRIVDVEPTRVRLQLLDGMESEVRTISLRPHQTYRALSGKIVEGEQAP